MTLEQQIEQEANAQIEDIKRVFPDIGEQKLKYIFICIKQSYVKGGIIALSSTSKNQIK